MSDKLTTKFYRKITINKSFYTFIKINDGNLNLPSFYLLCIGHIFFLLCFFVDMLLRNSIFARIASNRYISYYARNSICCLRQRVSIAPFLLAPQGISSALAPYRVADISSDASAAHIDVETIVCEDKQ